MPCGYSSCRGLDLSFRSGTPKVSGKMKREAAMNVATPANSAQVEGAECMLVTSLWASGPRSLECKDLSTMDQVLQPFPH